MQPPARLHRRCTVIGTSDPAPGNESLLSSPGTVNIKILGTVVEIQHQPNMNQVYLFEQNQ